MKNSHIACHAAALSWILQRKLTIDPVKEEFVNDDEANGLRSRPGPKVLIRVFWKMARRRRTHGKMARPEA